LRCDSESSHTAAHGVTRRFNWILSTSRRVRNAGQSSTSRERVTLARFRYDCHLRSVRALSSSSAFSSLATPVPSSLAEVGLDRVPGQDKTGPKKPSVRIPVTSGSGSPLRLKCCPEKLITSKRSVQGLEYRGRIPLPQDAGRFTDKLPTTPPSTSVQFTLKCAVSRRCI